MQISQRINKRQKIMRKIKSVTKAPKGNMKGGWKKGYKAITKFKAIRSKAQLKFQNIIRKRFCHTPPPFGQCQHSNQVTGDPQSIKKLHNSINFNLIVRQTRAQKLKSNWSVLLTS